MTDRVTMWVNLFNVIRQLGVLIFFESVRNFTFKILRVVVRI